MSAPSHDSDLESDPAGAVLDDSDEDDDFASIAEHPSSPRDPVSSLAPELPDLSPHNTSDQRPSSPTRSVSPAPAPSPLPAPERPSMSSVERNSLSRSRSVQSGSPSLRAANTRSNRLSGFLTSLKPRQPSLPRRPSSATHPSPARHVSKAPEPLPPSLLAPSLDDLGLSLNVITPSLSPSHFATPPTSGAFLQPHYLLLCHSQGLDVVPLAAPPAAVSYALIRRVPFKTVLVMEERGVLVAIAGRRDGVRVYALEEVRKAIEWRMEVEIQREREKTQREEGKNRKSMGDIKGKAIPQKPGVYAVTLPSSTNSRGSTMRHSSAPSTAPPRYTAAPTPAPTPVSHAPPPRTANLSAPGRPSRERGHSVHKHMLASKESVREDEEKLDWMDGASDDEALIAAGPSGSAALDERTSAIVPARNGVQSPEPGDEADIGVMGEPLDPPVVPASPPASTVRRHRPTSLRLESSNLADENNAVPAAALSPSAASPTVFSLQRAMFRGTGPMPSQSTPPTRQNETISFAQALFESRLPNSASSPLTDSRVGPRTLHHPNNEGDDSHSDNLRIPAHRPSLPNGSPGRPHQRHWSIMENSQPTSSASLDMPRTPHASTRPTNPSFLSAPPPNSLGPRSAPPTRSSRSPSVPVTPSRQFTPLSRNVSNPAPNTSVSATRTPTTPRRFLPKFLTAAFRSNEKKTTGAPEANSTSTKVPPLTLLSTLNTSPPPKLEYVKLPGTKNALMIKAVETPKKSFLAILCGDNGEKVELFAGTYRTALGLSRTFILPDSPRSLELQLQGDDLVELFLMFAQNVFGLEPATVRVREVRIGRAERRAARRRAVRESGTAEALLSGEGTGEGRDGLASLGEVPVANVITTVVSVGNSTAEAGPSGRRRSVPNIGGPRTVSGVVHAVGDRPSASQQVAGTSQASPAVEENAAKALNILGPYSTFQQLSFAPHFPLASIADEYIIPPTYLSFLDYQKQYEKPTHTEETDSGSSNTSDDSPPSPLLISQTTEKPLRWVYKDPKGVMQGPWDSTTMQNWLRDGFLPPDLPLRREHETELITLHALQAASSDPDNPFAPGKEDPLLNQEMLSSARVDPAIPTTSPQAQPWVPVPDVLLAPTSLLVQPKHFGPPALFYTSRGGHSTAIVDSRGRSVLKGRLVWSPDRQSEVDPGLIKLGEVKRLEAFDTKDHRAVVVALRQGGIEAIDMGDALLQPGDESRTSLPLFVSPPNSTSRRSNFVWRLGSPVEDVSTTISPFGISPRRETTLARSAPSPASKRLGSGKRVEAPKELDEFASMAPDDEIIFLGRNQDQVYACERNTNSFRILRLSPTS